ncbi:hypothetical protein C900_00436 [Fulvivirga imtechensis AK7]|uniref:Uncharacterized protein n=1 Tax=Fulvivirga imtechensis AK7 TaxID=1237149 RepID=L8JLL6_9BACT|nr:hypothetical protein [Fulvivirga imtechensis]ELR68404.1 hypothetical protein C900_00436 [Fulvivirga imtechensis AK7]
MKKLESLNADLFRVPKDQLSFVKGGKMMEDSITYSYELTDTAGTTTCDKKQTDTCIDF